MINVMEMVLMNVVFAAVIITDMAENVSVMLNLLIKLLMTLDVTCKYPFRF